jgi:hypothetical protein
MKKLPALLRPGRSLRPVLVAGILGVGLIAIPLMAFSASAAIVGCRTDPVVMLSNGQTATLWDNIADTASDVQSIKYVLHGPTGTSATSITYSGAVSKRAQTFQYVADQSPGQYDGYTTITTGTSQVQISAYLQVGSVVSGNTSALTGPNGFTIHTHVNSVS